MIGIIVDQLQTTNLPLIYSMTTIAATRITEAQKKANPTDYISNPATGKYVKRTSAVGKQLTAAENDPTVVVNLPISEIERLNIFVQVLVENFDLDTDAVVKLFTEHADTKDIVPRNFMYNGKPARKIRNTFVPNKPSNAYFYYTLSARKSKIDANPELSNAEIVKEMAQEWMALSDKVRYDSEMEEFQSANPTPKTPKKATPKTPVIAVAPKKAKKPETSPAIQTYSTVEFAEEV